jgi:hypothetical protein
MGLSLISHDIKYPGRSLYEDNERIVGAGRLFIKRTIIMRNGLRLYDSRNSKAFGCVALTDSVADNHRPLESDFFECFHHYLLWIHTMTNPGPRHCTDHSHK